MPDFSQMSDPSVIVEPPNTYQPVDNNTSQTRLSCREQTKRNHRSKKKRRHWSSSSSSSTSSTSSGPYKCSKKSKRSKHSHKKRRRQSMSPSTCSHSQSENDFGRYKRSKRNPQVAGPVVPLQPVESVDTTPVNIPQVSIAQSVPENIQTTKDSGSDSEAKIWSLDRAINEVSGSCPRNCVRKLSMNKLCLNLYLA